MCDYSLAHFPNRLAVEGEELVIHRFSTGTLGLASPDHKRESTLRETTAVCVPPGARLLLQAIPKAVQDEFVVREIEEVTFIEKSAEAYQYRDGVRFSNGQAMLLQRLPCGLHIRVLSLDSQAHSNQRPTEASSYADWLAAGPIL